mmetsp:Transcript_11122/g.19081  ORF Transcript_11122/g.19081 Transcript_11122/m.19081 type:complete len:196 (+) Transcript_11122:35-622(+)
MAMDAAMTIEGLMLWEQLLLRFSVREWRAAAANCKADAAPEEQAIHKDSSSKGRRPCSKTHEHVLPIVSRMLALLVQRAESKLAASAFAAWARSLLQLQLVRRWARHKDAAECRLIRQVVFHVWCQPRLASSYLAQQKRAEDAPVLVEAPPTLIAVPSEEDAAPQQPPHEVPDAGRPEEETTPSSGGSWWFFGSS